MSEDIVKRLRKEISKRDRPYPVELIPELREAADEIKRLRTALHHIADAKYSEPYSAEYARDVLNGRVPAPHSETVHAKCCFCGVMEELDHKRSCRICHLERFDDE